ncbi:stress enhanced protein 1, chloroplastic-like [Olea europaea var. sylvestris]|uniref:stress enhanced protein 1, chloroplastic-like n=1 Tax=Olea europaea var. sylvestris TaxID=158386 RepID=UPI000C1D43BB|nr:stress enhanced protein 1, chloroplastic-like [Olea europaea var. sylvestris]
MAMAQISNPLCYNTSIRDVFVSTPATVISTAGFSRKFGTAFATGSSILIQRHCQRNPATKATSVSIRCEQSTKEGSSLDVWLGRLAMVGFATAISIEIATGKGLLENFGLTAPLPTVALAVTALVGVLTAVFIFQSASEN